MTTPWDEYHYYCHLHKRRTRLRGPSPRPPSLKTPARGLQTRCAPPGPGAWLLRPRAEWVPLTKQIDHQQPLAPPPLPPTAFLPRRSCCSHQGGPWDISLFLSPLLKIFLQWSPTPKPGLKAQAPFSDYLVTCPHSAVGHGTRTASRERGSRTARAAPPPRTPDGAPAGPSCQRGRGARPPRPASLCTQAAGRPCGHFCLCSINLSVPRGTAGAPGPRAGTGAGP